MHKGKTLVKQSKLRIKNLQYGTMLFEIHKDETLVKQNFLDVSISADQC